MRKQLMNVPVFVFLLVTGCQTGRPAQNVLSLMPEPDGSKGWKWDLALEIYTPENLFEYINGEAEEYNAYRFIEMATSSHARTDNELASITFDIYDMGTPLNAFGIYSNQRRPGLEFEAIGEEAVVSDLNIRFYKGRFFVQLNAGSMDEVVKEALREQAEHLAAVIDASAEPEELSFLPARNQLPYTLKYLAEGLLGQAAFQSGLQADYLLPSGECSAFAVPKESNESAREALNRFATNLISQGLTDEDLVIDESGGFVAQTRYFGKVITQAHSRFVIGVVGFHSQEEAQGLLEEIRTCLDQ